MLEEAMSYLTAELIAEQKADALQGYVSGYSDILD